MENRFIQNRLKKYHVIFALVVLLLFASGFAKPNESNSKQPLLFLGNEKLPPMVYQDHGIPKGIVVDIVEALEGKLGRHINVKLMDWTKAQKIVEAGEADALIQINENEERKVIFDFSEPLLDSKFSIFGLRGDRQISGAKDLEGQRVGVEEKGFPRLVLEQNPLVQLVYIPNILDGFHMLKEGKIDAVVADEWVGTYILANNQMEDVYVVGEPIVQLQSAIAVKKGNTELLAAINEGLTEMKADGTYQHILEKWKPKEVVYLTKEQIRLEQLQIWTRALIMFIILISVCSILLIRQLLKSKRMEKELSVEHRRLSDIITGTNAGTWEWSIQTGEFIVNERWAQILGYGLEEIMPVNVDSWKASMHPDDLRQAEELLYKNFNKELDYYEFECRMKHKDEGWIWVVERGYVAEWDSRNKPLLMSGIRQDVTDRKNAEMAIVQAKQRAETANLAKGQFLANMAHEIRTPLNGIMGMQQLLQMTELSKDQANYIRISLTSSNSLLQVLNDILDYSKLEAGKLHFEMLEFHIRKFVKDIIMLFQPSAMNKGLALDASIDNSVPEFLVGDSFRLRQILTNLIGNAIKFTEEGRIDLSVKVVQESSNNTVKLKFAVKDTGAGIPQDKIQDIFESFTQADISDTRKYGGTGLGLSICKKLVEIMKGEIWVDSTEGIGSVFSFTGVFEQIEKAHDETVSGSREIKAFEENLPLHFLIAEDDEISMLVIKRLVERMGWRATTVGNGKEAVDLYQREAFDVILMDCQMPVMDGYRATGLIRELEARQGKHTPIIAITAYAFDSDQVKCMNAGMDDYLKKPLEIDKFYQMIEKWVK